MHGHINIMLCIHIYCACYTCLIFAALVLFEIKLGHRYMYVVRILSKIYMRIDIYMCIVCIAEIKQIWNSVFFSFQDWSYAITRVPLKLTYMYTATSIYPYSYSVQWVIPSHVYTPSHSHYIHEEHVCSTLVYRRALEVHVYYTCFKHQQPINRFKSPPMQIIMKFRK